MKKISTITLAALMTMAVSCKKDKIEKTDNGNPIVTIEQSPDVTRIIKFNNDVKLRRENPDLRTREVITLDEAKDNIADLFNAVYGEPAEYYGETERAEFSVTLPVDADGNVLLDDAVAAYEEAVELARESYHASTLENKGYICMSATIEEQRGGTAEVKLNGVFGKKTEAPTAAGYFDESLNWLYKYGAVPSCDEYEDDGADAALECAMKGMLIAGKATTPKGYRLITYGVKGFDFSGYDYQNLLFYREGVYADETCISGDLMNFYLDNGIDIITNVIPDSEGFHCDRGSMKVYKVVSLTVKAYDNDDNNQDAHYYITHRYTGEYGLQDYMLASAIQQYDL
ncbi:MAG: hypothetical protein MJZ56_01345 [Bacteroidales bacterium]|nr:hypothetical protein [Bacteroidales bacterium]